MVLDGTKATRNRVTQGKVVDIHLNFTLGREEVAGAARARNRKDGVNLPK